MRLILPLLLVACSTLAQNPRWWPGTVVLTSREVLNGDLCFQTADLVLFRTSDELRVLTPAQLESFHFFDVDADLHHRFVSVQDERGHSRFFELVVSGDVQVLRLFSPTRPLERPLSDRDDFDYYVRFAGEWIHLRHFHHRVLPSLLALDQNLSGLIRSNNLQSRRVADAVRIAVLYNERHRAHALVVAGRP